MAERNTAPSLEKEARILDAAQRRFAIFGLNKVTMDEIAADIGMGKASLYYYFPTKEELLRAVILREQQIFLGRLDEIGELAVPAREKLRLYAERQIDFFAELANLQLLNLQGGLYSRPLFRDLKAALNQAELQFLTRLLEAGVASGEFRPLAITPTAAALLHTLQGLRLRVLRLAELQIPSDNPPQTLAADIRPLLDLLLFGLCSSGTACLPHEASHGA